MKVSKVEIKEYKQFKDLTLDLTYPKGHEKEGQPLDKICIIGQSGVGKTNLLEIIRDKRKVNVTFTEKNNSLNENIYFSNINKICSKVKTDDIEYLDRIKKNIKELFLQTTPFFLLFFLIYIFLKITNLFIEKEVLDSVLYIVLFVIILGIGILSLISIFTFGTAFLMLKIKDILKMTDKYVNNKSYIELDETAWLLVKEKIDNYSEEEKSFNSKLFNKIMINKSYTKQAEEDKKEWEAKNKNILQEISDKLNFILNKFNLELIKIDKNQKSYNDLIFKDLSNGNIIEYDNLSTGTKNIISTFIPLKIHNPKDSIILIDEPENSFYPDIQCLLTELYIEVGENNQLIMATHSPLIASSFEPWEVLELKFDKNNQIYRKNYFEGDRHIDNYILDPRLLTWTGILVDIFDMKEDSNALEREKSLMKYIRLERELKNIKDKTLKKEKFEELMKLSDLLGLIHNEEN